MQRQISEVAGIAFASHLAEDPSHAASWPRLTATATSARRTVVLAFNQRAYARLPADKQLVIIPAATHLFEEPGALEEVACRAAQWFARYLGPQPVGSS